ncbi:MAG: S1C family serine protease [Anaerolineae bacterium]
MMNRGRSGLVIGIGCAVLLVFGLLLFSVFAVAPRLLRQAMPQTGEQITPPQDEPVGRVVAPTITPAPPVESPNRAVQANGLDTQSYVQLYEDVNPGVVSIQVFTRRGDITSQGAGSGFVIDDNGHIVTNNHVIAGAVRVTVIFYNGIEAEATVVGTDPDSDLAVIRVDDLPEDVHPLVLGNSDDVQVGELVIAIGNPFGQQGSMTAGIVSAVGRVLPTQVTQFSIPQAIQTDTAINPGNSGGPLLNLQGQVIGVNAQIATAGNPASAGVGFAIPVNVVRQIAPVLIETGSYQWPWVGVSGTSVNLLIQQANDLPTQSGAYIAEVIPGGPAAAVGLRGSTGAQRIDGFDVPVGGDVIIAVDGEVIEDFSDLLVNVAFRRPGDELELTYLRDGQERQVRVTLAPRPNSVNRSR